MERRVPLARSAHVNGGSDPPGSRYTGFVPMPEKTPCRHCKQVGFVRTEHVIKAGTAFREFYCGRCDHSWREIEDEPKEAKPRRPSDERPDRSRS